MANKILFEEDVSEKKDKNIKIVQEHTNQENNIRDKNNLDNNEQNDSQTETTVTTNEKITEKPPNTTHDNYNHEIDDNTVNMSNVIQENSTNNTSTDTVPTNSNSSTTAILPEVPVEQSGTINPSSAQGPTMKVKKKSELELLGVDVKAMEECDTQFDAFEADRQICRKYKLRKAEQQVSYKEPGNFPLRRPTSSPVKRPTSSAPKRTTNSSRKRKTSSSRKRTPSSTSKRTPSSASKRTTSSASKRTTSSASKHPTSSKVPPDEPPSLTCPTCEYAFDSLRGLKVHVRSHGVTNREYTCSICSENFKNNADLLAHKVIHSGESFVCEQCKLAFSDHCDFLLHNVIHAGTSDIKCPECGLLYNRKSYYYHIKTHFSKKHKCLKCSFVTNFEENLESHVKKMHSSTYECVECGRTLKSKAQFDYHMSTHTGVKKYQCLYCGKGFAAQNQRNVHTSRLHEGKEKRYSCDICGYRAFLLSDIKSHKRTHETEKFSCDVCSKKFMRKESLLDHMTSHTKRDMYDCPACDHRYTTSVGLRSHILMKHTNERPWVCTFCNKSFINNNQYRQHTGSKIHKRRVYGHLKQKGELQEAKLN